MNDFPGSYDVLDAFAFRAAVEAVEGRAYRMGVARGDLEGGTVV